MDLFPEIGLDISKFHHQRIILFFIYFFKNISFIFFLFIFSFLFLFSLCFSFFVSSFFFPFSFLSFLTLLDVWKEKENRRKFFEHYARDTGFDPLVASNWYNQPREQIKALRVFFLLILLFFFLFLFFLFVLPPFLSSFLPFLSSFPSFRSFKIM